MENPGEWGVQIKDSSVGGYGYFLEPHIVEPPFFEFTGLESLRKRHRNLLRYRGLK